MDIFVKFWNFLPCPLTKYGHVTSPKLQISKSLNFDPNSKLLGSQILGSHKISGGKVLCFRSYQVKISQGGGKHPREGMWGEK